MTKRTKIMKTLIPTEKPRIQTASVFQDHVLDLLLQQAEYDIKQAQTDLEGFASKVKAGNPVYAFEWSRKAFEDAARFEIARLIVQYVTHLRNADEYSMPSSGKILRVIREEFYREVLRRARWPEHSTSPQSNEMALMLNARRAEWLDVLDRRIERIDDQATVTL